MWTSKKGNTCICYALKQFKCEVERHFLFIQGDRFTGLIFCTHLFLVWQMPRTAYRVFKKNYSQYFLILSHNPRLGSTVFSLQGICLTTQWSFFFFIHRYSCHKVLEKVNIFGSPVFLDVKSSLSSHWFVFFENVFIFPSQHKDIQSTSLSPLFQIHSLKEGDMTHSHIIFLKRTIHFWCEGQGLHTKEFGCLWSLCNGVASLMPKKASLDS